MEEDYRSLLKRIDKSFQELNGNPLPSPPDIPDRYTWLHENAPYSILAHNADTDPHFVYANVYALSCFKYTSEEMLSLLSRLSAAEQDRAERQRLLEIVKRNGIAYAYEGPRVDKYGNSFMIYDGVLWQLADADNKIWGQGALFWTQKGNHPAWFSNAINK